MLTVGDLKELLNKIEDDYNNEPVAIQFNYDALYYVIAVKDICSNTVDDYDKEAIVLQIHGSDYLNTAYTKEKILGKY